MFNIFKKKEKVVIDKPALFRIEECIDTSQTPEKYLIFKDEIISPLIDALRKICILEENCIKQNEILEENKRKLGIPKHQVADGWKEMIEQYQVDYATVVEPICTDKLLKRGFARSYGKPAEYAYINTGCKIYFIMKSAKKAVVETHFHHGVETKHQFVFKNVEGRWLIDEKKYAHGDDWHMYSI